MKAIEAPTLYEVTRPYQDVEFNLVVCYSCLPVGELQIEATEEGVMQHVRETGHDAALRFVRSRTYFALATQ